MLIVIAENDFRWSNGNLRCLQFFYRYVAMLLSGMGAKQGFSRPAADRRWGPSPVWRQRGRSYV